MAQEFGGADGSTQSQVHIKEKPTGARKRLEYLQRRNGVLDAEMMDAMLARDRQRIDNGRAAKEQLMQNSDPLVEAT